MKYLTILLGLLFSFSTQLDAQNHQQKIERQVQFADPGSSANYLKIFNINGNVTVEGYAGNEIMVEAEMEIESEYESEIEVSREELEFRVVEEDDLVLIYIDAPFIEIKRRGDKINYRIDRWDDNYEFLFDISVRVPRNTHIHASTINRGMVTIRHTAGEVSASNINGEITLEQITGKTKARTVNGDITARYHESPEQDSDYHTVNGTIEVNYPIDLSADIRFESLHGELYTDFENIKRLQSQVQSDRKQRNGRTRYRVDKNSPIRIGQGGPKFSFKVLNGNVYIKKIQS